MADESDDAAGERERRRQARLAQMSRQVHEEANADLSEISNLRAKALKLATKTENGAHFAALVQAIVAIDAQYGGDQRHDQGFEAELDRYLRLQQKMAQLGLGMQRTDAVHPLPQAQGLPALIPRPQRNKTPDEMEAERRPETSPVRQPPGQDVGGGQFEFSSVSAGITAPVRMAFGGERGEPLGPPPGR